MASLYNLLQTKWIFNIVKNMIYQDLVQKIFYKDLTINDFKLVPDTTPYLIVTDEKIDLLTDRRAFLFRSALEFIHDLNSTDDFTKLDEMYQFQDARETLFANGRVFKNDFYNYVFQLYLFYKMSH